jgi:hypothetical protein
MWSAAVLFILSEAEGPPPFEADAAAPKLRLAMALPPQKRKQASALQKRLLLYTPPSF